MQWKIPQLIKYFPFQHEQRSLRIHTFKKLVMVVLACNLNSGETETVDPWDSLTNNCSPHSKFHASERHCLKKRENEQMNIGQNMRNSIQDFLLNSVCTRTHTHTCNEYEHTPTCAYILQKILYMKVTTVLFVIKT